MLRGTLITLGSYTGSWGPIVWQFAYSAILPCSSATQEGCDLCTPSLG